MARKEDIKFIFSMSKRGGYRRLQLRNNYRKNFVSILPRDFCREISPRGRVTFCSMILKRPLDLRLSPTYLFESFITFSLNKANFNIPSYWPCGGGSAETDTVQTILRIFYQMESLVFKNIIIWYEGTIPAERTKRYRLKSNSWCK
jgi:hypothetical protein